MKGSVPWNKGKKMPEGWGENLTQWVKRNGSPRKGVSLSKETKSKISASKIGVNSGKGNYQWKGDYPPYRALHIWVQKTLGTPTQCTHCNKEGTGHNMQWANKDGKYRRAKEDWIRLCAKCHKNYDLGHLQLT